MSMEPNIRPSPPGTMAGMPSGLWAYQALPVTALRAYASGRNCQKISTPGFVSEQREFKASIKMIIIEKWWG